MPKTMKSLKDSKPGAHQSKTLSQQLGKTTKSTLLPNEDFVENFVVIPPDGGWGWIIVVMAFVCNFIADGVMYTFGIFLVEISESFNVHPTKVALATSLMSGFYFVVGPVTCAITNRYGFRVVGMIGGILCCIAFFLSTIFLNLNAFLILIGVVCGVGFNMTFIPSLLIVGFYFEKWRAFATAVAVCGSSIGVIVFPPVVTSVLRSFHWTWKFRILSGLTLLSSVCAISFRPIKPIKVGESRKVTLDLENKDSIGSFSINSKPFGTNSFFQNHHNNSFPSTSACNDTSSTYIFSRQINDDITVSDSSIARSTFIYRTDNQSASLSTVYEFENEKDNKRKCCNCCYRRDVCCCCIKTSSKRKSRQTASQITESINRPMYRDDIFYAGSLYLLPEYSRATVVSGPSTRKSAVSYHLSVTRIATQRDIEESGRCVCCPEAVVRTIATMLHFKLLKSPTFMMLTISGFFTLLGMYCPFIFLVQRATDMNISVYSSTMLLTIIGIANTIGRILCGVTSWFPKIDAIVISYVTLIITGCSIIVSNYLKNVGGQMAFAAIFGFNIASLTALRSLVIVELMGLENLTNAFGITTMFYGVGSFIGVPVAGILQNYTGKYDASFIFAGCSILLSGILIIPLRRISKWETNRKRRVSFKT